MNISRMIVFLILALAVSSCGISATQYDYATSPQGRTFMRLYDALKRNDRAVLNPNDDRTDEQRRAFDRQIDFARNYMAEHTLQFIRFDGWKQNIALSGKDSSEIVGWFRQTESPNHWLKVTGVFEGDDKQIKLVDARFQEIEDVIFNDVVTPYKWLSEFRVWQWLVLLVCATPGLISIFVFVHSLLSRPKGVEWLWPMFALVGVLPVWISFQDGSMSFHPGSIVLPAGGLFGWLARFGFLFFVGDNASENLALPNYSGVISFPIASAFYIFEKFFRDRPLQGPQTGTS